MFSSASNYLQLGDMGTTHGGFSPGCPGCQAAAELYQSSFPLCQPYQMAELGVFLPDLVGLRQGPTHSCSPCGQILNTCGSLSSWDSFHLACRGLPLPLRYNCVPLALAVGSSGLGRMSAPLRALPNTLQCACVLAGAQGEICRCWLVPKSLPEFYPIPQQSGGGGMLVLTTNSTQHSYPLLPSHPHSPSFLVPTSFLPPRAQSGVIDTSSLFRIRCVCLHTRRKSQLFFRPTYTQSLPLLWPEIFANVPKATHPPICGENSRVPPPVTP